MNRHLNLNHHPSVKDLKAAQHSHLPTEVKRRPQWWNEGHENSWTLAKEGVANDWDMAAEQGKKLERAASEEALAFGHGARMAYQMIEEWGEALEMELKRDWKTFARGADQEWEMVKSVVQYGWRRAREAVTPSKPEVH